VLLEVIGMMTSVLQRLIIYRFKDNVTLDMWHISLELSIVINSVFFLKETAKTSNFNTFISDSCDAVIKINKDNLLLMNQIYTQRQPLTGYIRFDSILSIMIIQTCISILFMLQRTKQMGQLIMLLTFMISEIFRFFSTFGIMLGIFVIILKLLSSLLLYNPIPSIWLSFITLYRSFNGNQVLNEFKFPEGQVYAVLYIYIFQIFLMALLVAMFINRQSNVSKNLEAFRRFNIIKLKNSEQYDQYIGGVTLTFFPINILMLPFMVPVVIFRNPRISDFALKLQYSIMMFLYILIAILITLPMLPMVYLKQITNSIYIYVIGKREEYPG
jgi:hypothetical protein